MHLNDSSKKVQPHPKPLPRSTQKRWDWRIRNKEERKHRISVCLPRKLAQNENQTKWDDSPNHLKQRFCVCCMSLVWPRCPSISSGVCFSFWGKAGRELVEPTISHLPSVRSTDTCDQNTTALRKLLFKGFHVCHRNGSNHMVFNF